MSKRTVFTINDKLGKAYELVAVNSAEIQSHLVELIKFRLKYFRAYPYLYEGSDESEREYLEAYSKDAKSLLVLVKHEGELVAVSTALPLNSDAKILGEAPKLLLKKDQDAEDYFYFGEVIVDENHRGNGLAREIYKFQEQYALKLAYSKTVIATVVRSDEDPRRPDSYKKTDGIWSSFGYEKTDVQVQYEWPTILEDKSVKNISNSMVFWVKEL